MLSSGSGNTLLRISSCARAASYALPSRHIASISGADSSLLPRMIFWFSDEAASSVVTAADDGFAVPSAVGRISSRGSVSAAESGGCTRFTPGSGFLHASTQTAITAAAAAAVPSEAAIILGARLRDCPARAASSI